MIPKSNNPEAISMIKRRSCPEKFTVCCLVGARSYPDALDNRHLNRIIAHQTRQLQRDCMVKVRRHRPRVTARLVPRRLRDELRQRMPQPKTPDNQLIRLDNQRHVWTPICLRNPRVSQSLAKSLPKSGRELGHFAERHSPRVFFSPRLGWPGLRVSTNLGQI